MRNLALGAGTTDVIDAGCCRAADFRQRMIVERRGLAGRREGVMIGHVFPSPQYASALSMLKL